MAKKQKIYIGVFGFLFLLFFIFFILSIFAPVGNRWKDYELINYELEGRSYKLLVSDTPIKQERGFMYVSYHEVENVDGMIFTFPEKKVRSFWNENTHINLTVYWLDDDNVVGKSDLQATDSIGRKIVYSPEPVNNVIEIVDK